jgi:DNA-binding response OmpR family regulator
MPFPARPISSLPKSILIVDDDELLLHSLRYSLEQAGYQVQLAASAKAALETIDASPPHLVLLDIGLPDISGLEVIRRIRDVCPVIFVSGRQRQLDELLGLELGAEDYVSKPFDTDILLARIRNVLRRAVTTISTEPSPHPTSALVAGDLTVDPVSHTVSCNRRSINLSPLEFRLLHLLADEAPRVLSTEELLQRVWGEQYKGESQIVYVYIGSLREKLEENPKVPQRILTVRGVGYRFVAQRLSNA